MHQRVAQFRQLIIKLLSQAASQEGEPFKQALHIRISSRLTEKRRQRWATLSETATQLA
ncbi:hypothetical protein D3C84_952440 [compost metagenome]